MNEHKWKVQPEVFCKYLDEAKDKRCKVMAEHFGIKLSTANNYKTFYNKSKIQKFEKRITKNHNKVKLPKGIRESGHACASCGVWFNQEHGKPTLCRECDTNYRRGSFVNLPLATHMEL